jgi:hypothetical protein
MAKPLRFVFSIILLISCQLYAQNPVPNAGMEEWTYDQVTDSVWYEEPSGVWTTANRASRLNPKVFKVTTFKTDDAHSGNYAARMISDLADLPGTNDLLMTGTVAIGEFNEMAPPPTNLLDGMPFTDRPARFRAWYKYFSVNHDSCDMYAILYKWNSQLHRRDTIGYAWNTDSLIVPEYTLLDIPFIYFMEEDPDTISIIFASSAAGDLFEGQIGSTLFVDDISLELSNGMEMLFMSEIRSVVYPNPANDLVTIELSEPVKNGRLVIHSVNGQELARMDFSGDKVTTGIKNFPEGIYTYQLIRGNQIISTGRFVKSSE